MRDLQPALHREQSRAGRLSASPMGPRPGAEAVSVDAEDAVHSCRGRCRGGEGSEGVPGRLTP